MLDPGNTLYSRMPLSRLDAESLYDALLAVADRLDRTMFGSADPVQVRADGLVTPTGNDRGWRRLIYVQQQRKRLATHLENFDFPPMNPNCIERRDSTVVPQALHLMNNGMIDKLAESFAARAYRVAARDLDRQVETVHRIGLSRPPSAEEREAGVQALGRLAATWAENLASKAESDDDEAARKALETYCHAVMNSAAFLYVD
jgi:hypothetical protein